MGVSNESSGISICLEFELVLSAGNTLTSIFCINFDMEFGTDNDEIATLSEDE